MGNDADSAIQKSLDGVGLGLSAMAEVIAKVDGRIAQLEQVEIKKRHDDEVAQEAEEEQAAFDNFEKSIVQKAIRAISSEFKKQDQGLDLGKDEENEVGGKVQWPMSSRDDVAVKGDKTDDALDADSTADSQRTIAAMNYSKDDELGSEELPIPPVDEDEDEVDEAEMAMMRKQVARLTKQIEKMSSGQDEAIKKEAESRLRKMGWAEENKLRSPKLVKQDTSLGAHGDLIQKSSQGTGDESLGRSEIVAKLTEVPWSELWDLKVQKEAEKQGVEVTPGSGAFNLNTNI